MTNLKYILLVDKEQDVLNIQKLGISFFYDGDIFSSKDGVQSLDIVKKLGLPELIVADYGVLEEIGPTLYPYIVEKGLVVPLIICSGSIEFEFSERKFPGVTTFIQKPFSIESLSLLIKSMLPLPAERPDYVAVKITSLLVHGKNQFDLYLKLSERNFVKVFKKGEPFTKDDVEHYFVKGVTDFYLEVMDGLTFLRIYEESISSLVRKGAASTADITIAMESLEAIESISKRIGWTKDVVESAQKSVRAALTILSHNDEISAVLKKRLANFSSPYARHIGLLSYLSCAFCSDLEWTKDSGALKLAMAALTHDLMVADSYYENIKEWNKKAANLKDKNPEVTKYRLHPIEASRLVQAMDTIPPDVDQILLQHHELKDGTGFPRSLTASRITQLASLFIIVEELVSFIDDGVNLETSITDFLTWGDEFYDVGHFKKIYGVIKARLKNF